MRASRHVEIPAHEVLVARQNDQRISKKPPAHTPRVLVVIPTYNEAENLPQLIAALLELEESGLEVLVVDDHSPDGTGHIADRLSKEQIVVHVLHRKKKAGLGAAYADGFAWALAHGADFVVSMDADFSHNPKDVPRLLEQKESAAIVLGSRYIPGGTIVGWDWKRYVNSYGANIVTKLLLGLPVRDATSGFKVYRRSFLASLDLPSLIASGYAFQVEMLMKAHQQGLAIAEIPITFVDRRAGSSKIEGEVSKSARVIFQLAAQRQGLRQFVKFCLIGLLNVVVDWSIYFLLNHLTPIHKLGAKLLSFIAGASNSYYFNRTWTFRSRSRQVGREFGKFFLVASIGALLNTGIFGLIALRFGFPDIIGLIVATGAVTFWNFFANKYWTFHTNRIIQKAH